MMRRLVLLAAALAVVGSASAQSVGANGSVAILRGLDKVTGLYQDFSAPVGKTVKFHTLDVTVRACQKAPAEETPETAVFVEVTDNPRPAPGAKTPPPVKMLSGWIFGSSPALNALEHPAYDIWAIDCR